MDSGSLSTLVSTCIEKRKESQCKKQAETAGGGGKDYQKKVEEGVERDETREKGLSEVDLNHGRNGWKQKIRNSDHRTG